MISYKYYITQGSPNVLVPQTASGSFDTRNLNLMHVQMNFSTLAHCGPVGGWLMNSNVTDLLYKANLYDLVLLISVMHLF